MPVGGYSVGRDISVSVVGADGSVITMAKITGFDRKQRTGNVEIKRLDGNVDFLELPQGWDGSFEVERDGPAIDDYIATLESAYYNGTNILFGTITETITEPDGSTTQYRYTGVALRYPDAGSWKGDSSVKLKLEFMASRRLKVS